MNEEDEDEDDAKRCVLARVQFASPLGVSSARLNDHHFQCWVSPALAGQRLP